MGRAVATVVVVSLVACASRPTKEGDMLAVPLRDAVEGRVGDFELQLRVPAEDLVDNPGPRPASDLEIPASPR
jgi:hypothetical protein